mgnify:CR=1 FL=1
MKKTKNDNHLEENQKSALEQALDQAKRYAADYQNLEKRINEEKSSWIKTANKDLIIKHLPVRDDLYKANDHLKDPGLTLIIQKLNGILNKEGLTTFISLGMPFNPESMNSLGTAEADEQKDGRVVEEVRSGYKLNGQVIRPAEVIVGQKKVELTN